MIFKHVYRGTLLSAVSMTPPRLNPRYRVWKGAIRHRYNEAQLTAATNKAEFKAVQRRTVQDKATPIYLSAVSRQIYCDTQHKLYKEGIFLADTWFLRYTLQSNQEFPCLPSFRKSIETICLTYDSLVWLYDRPFFITPQHLRLSRRLPKLRSMQITAYDVKKFQYSHFHAIQGTWTSEECYGAWPQP